MNEPKRFYAAVYGPNARTSFGADSWVIASPANVLQNDHGNLVIKVAPEEAIPPYPGGPQGPAHSGRPARPGRTVIYARGEWHRVVIGEVAPR